MNANGNGDPDNAETPVKKKGVVFLQPEEAVTWQYINATNIGMSFWDIRIRFTLMAEATEESIKLKDVTAIIVSPQHAKALAAILSSTVKKYEDQFGPIPNAADISSVVSKQ